MSDATGPQTDQDGAVAKDGGDTVRGGPVGEAAAALGSIRPGPGAKAGWLRAVVQRWSGRLGRLVARGSGGLPVLALLVGVGAGLGAIAFRYMILGFTHLFTGHRDYSAGGHRSEKRGVGSRCR